MRKITVRAATEEECRSGNVVHRWLIVDAEKPDEVMYDAGMLGMVPEGGDHLLLTIERARNLWVKKRGYELVLVEEVKVLADALFAIYEELDFKERFDERDSLQGRIARLIHPSILWSDRMMDKRREEREARRG